MNTSEFFKKWGKGIQAITAYQQAKINLIGNVFIISGVLLGLYFSFTLRLWWLFLILTGSLFITSMGFLANIQKFLILRKIEMEVKKNEPKSTSRNGSFIDGSNRSNSSLDYGFKDGR